MIDRFAKIIVEIKKNIMRGAAGAHANAPRRRGRGDFRLSLEQRSPCLLPSRLLLVYMHFDFQIGFSQELFHLDKKFFF